MEGQEGEGILNFFWFLELIIVLMTHWWEAPEEDGRVEDGEKGHGCHCERDIKKEVLSRHWGEC